MQGERINLDESAAGMLAGLEIADGISISGKDADAFVRMRNYIRKGHTALVAATGEINQLRQELVKINQDLKVLEEQVKFYNGEDKENADCRPQ